MSRRHNSSRRRQYGRRQHEVRERRPGFAVERDWQQSPPTGDWRMADPEDDRTTSGGPDGFGGAQL
jgi:hypothetical protein